MRIAYGFWRFEKGDIDSAIEMIECARNAGITHFDTADVYGYPDFGAAEAILGEVRDRAPSLLQGIEIATKAGVEIGTPYNSSSDYVADAIDASLRRLQIDCVDLFYIHRPDFLTHPADLAATLDKIVTSGKAKAIGVSNYSASQLNALSAHLKTPVSAHQVEFSALHVAPIENGVFDLSMAQGIKAFAWSPLAGGRLFAGEDLKSIQISKVLKKIAKKRDRSLSTTALDFVLSHPAQLTAIVGTRNPARLAELATADFEPMDREDWYAVFQAARGEKLP